MTRFVFCNHEGRFGIRETIAKLEAGENRLDALEVGIRAVEANPEARSVGFGGKPNLLGEMECDAAVMDGKDRTCGSVGAVKNCLHVVSLARRVMAELPHVFLVGAGAEAFARTQGLASEPPLAPEAEEAHTAWLGNSETGEADWPGLVARSVQTWEAKDTTVFLASDGRDLAGATSTSGWGYKHPGRLGDSPVIGAGLYVDSRFGGCACTHTGEMTIRTAAAVSVVRLMQAGATVEQACRDIMEDLQSLKNGYLGAVVLHAVDRKGNPFAITTGKDGGVLAWFWREGMEEAECMTPEHASRPA